MIQRTWWPRLNPYAQLAKGLVFAGLGGGASTLQYADASGYGRNGTLTNMDGSNWSFDPTIGRWCVSCNGSDEYVLGRDVPSLLGVDYTVAVWCKLNTTQANYAAIWSKGDGTASDLALQRYSNTTTIRLYHGSSFADITGAWSTIATGTWVPVILTYRIASNVLTLWVSSASSSTTISADQGNTAGRTWKLGADRTPSVYTNGSFADWLIATRAWSEAECLAYSDLSNTMLSGLILPPRRMVFPAAVAGGDKTVSISSPLDVTVALEGFPIAITRTIQITG